MQNPSQQENISSEPPPEDTLMTKTESSGDFSDESPAWLLKYIGQMDAAAHSFPLTDEEIEQLHTQYYEPAYEQMLLSSAPGTGESPDRPVHERLKGKRLRAALTREKDKYVELNRVAGKKPYMHIFSAAAAAKNDFNHDNASEFLNLFISKCTSDALSVKHTSLAAVALSDYIASLSGANTEAEEHKAALEAQVSANRLLGSRVDELERENLELHRILDENTNKALDSWSSGQIKVAKLEEELKQLKEDKLKSDAAAEASRSEVNELQNKISRLRGKMEDFIEDEENEEKKVNYETDMSLCVCILLHTLIHFHLLS